MSAGSRDLGWPWPVVLLVGMLAAAGGLLLLLTSEMTFYQDTWAVLMERRDPSLDTALRPHSEHIIVVPVLVEQLFLRLFGMGDARPEYVLSTIALLGTAALLFVYLRRRIGDWLALFAVTLILFLGPAWEVLLWPFEIVFVGAVFFGLAALLALERGDGRGDLVACACLALSLACSSLGLAFLGGAAVALALGPRERWLGRAYVVVVPALAFGAWYVGWGRDAESHASLENLLDSPRWVAEAISANVGSLFGLNPDPTSGALGRGPNPEPGLDPIWNNLIVAALVLALVVRQVRRGWPSPHFWPVATIALGNWFLTALNYFPGREPTNSRYQYAGAIFALMVIATLFDGLRPRRATVAATGAVAALVLVPHLVVLVRGADFLEEQSVLTRADTAALEIARSTVDPAFQLTPEVAGTPTLPNVYAGGYFAAADEYGSPAYSPAELGTAPQEGRFQADVVLVHALPIGIATEPGGSAGGPGCEALAPGRKPEVALAPGTTTRVGIAPGPAVGLHLRRFASGEYPAKVEGLPGGSAIEVRIPADAVSRPWRLWVSAEQAVRICR